MKTATTLFLSTLLASQTLAFVAKPLPRRDDAAAVASNMAIYSSNNDEVYAQQSSLIALQATWNGGAAGAEATATTNPVVAEAKQTTAPAQILSTTMSTTMSTITSTSTSAAVTSAQDTVSSTGNKGGVFYQIPTTTTADGAAAAIPAPSIPTTPISVAAPTTPTNSPGSTQGRQQGRCGPGTPCDGPATAEGFFTPGTGACPHYTSSINYDFETMLGVAVPQWYSALMGVNPATGDQAVCGTAITVISNIDGQSYTAHVVDVDGPGGGQPVEEWLDMSDALYNKVVAPGSNAGGVYPQVKWFIGGN